MEVGAYVRTPRFLTVMINEVFDSVEAAQAAGYTETTHYWKDPDWDVFGKSIGTNRMVFAAARKGNTNGSSYV